MMYENGIVPIFVFIYFSLLQEEAAIEFILEKLAYKEIDIAALPAPGVDSLVLWYAKRSKLIDARKVIRG